jgi:hypothetical protein
MRMLESLNDWTGGGACGGDGGGSNQLVVRVARDWCYEERQDVDQDATKRLLVVRVRYSA